MSTKRKWASNGTAISPEGFISLRSDTIIYDTLKGRATQAGFVMGMPYRTVMTMLFKKRYTYAKRLED